MTKGIAGLVFLITSVAYCSAEAVFLRQLRRSRPRPYKKGGNNLLILYLTLGLVAGVSIGSFYGDFLLFQRGWAVLGIAGWVLLYSGLILRLVSIGTLRRHYTHSIAILEGHRLIKEGIYRYIRHPGYLSLLLVFLGIPLAFGSWVGLIIYGGLAIPLIIHRIRLEERLLEEHFREEYATYKEKTPCLFPFLH
ncbi:MAG: isoprenylcysteine carboxylmethyltransferase family protein [Candidatus Aminicenantes bacterium]|nr:isoprenylcysteine carboxylmethyltransferase family protein [Candidatus Aminicenantes bacterium]